MNNILKEICLLAVAASQATHAAIFFRSTKNANLQLLARSIGQPTTLDAKYQLKMLTEAHPILHIKNVKQSTQLLNHPILELEPGLKNLAVYYLLSTPEGSYTLAIYNAGNRYYENPFQLSLIGQLREVLRRLLDVDANTQHTADHFDDLDLLPNSLAEEAAHHPTIEENAEPASRFLFDTLVSRQRLLGRNGCSYLALRTWRKSIKQYQIDALRALKEAQQIKTVKEVAAEMSEAISRVYGAAFQTVVPVPGGSSGKEKAFSHCLATSVANNLNITFANVLEPQAVAIGSSHPKKSKTLQPYNVIGSTTGNILIIDDVATSGRHIECATVSLRPLTSFCSAVVWVSN